ncbi:hypothetical protein B0T20DRAFT_146267 [Sordaria brevicollis]|uniref:Uncharacterized protein n=1 Tax=Sordaria brevicollis TaxID=83679 RepID=A0AAE0PI94_SORBR|nr:hypothetical protein B0T20DRAFT_146267 [Sordaria brevicollis]
MLAIDNVAITLSLFRGLRLTVGLGALTARLGERVLTGNFQLRKPIIDPVFEPRGLLSNEAQSCLFLPGFQGLSLLPCHSHRRIFAWLQRR